MEIRHAREEDLPAIMDIYARARAYMAENGNPRQWGSTGWPPEELIREDIRERKSYVCEEDGEIAAVFFFDAGTDIEPTYAVIYDGQWRDGSAYGVVHRIASNGTVKGAGMACIQWAYARCGHLRIDTHGDNKIMQSLLEKLGFVYCGIIHIQQDDDPRLAYEKSGKTAGTERG